MTHLFKSLMIAASVSIFSISAFAQQNQDAAADAEHIISSQNQITAQDIANLQVISEICPTLIGKNKNFDDGLNKYLTQNLPGISNPTLAMKALSGDEDYQIFLKEARELAATQTQEKNREVCLSIIEWNKQK